MFSDQLEWEAVDCNSLQNKNKNKDLFTEVKIILKLSRVASKDFAKEMLKFLSSTSLTSKDYRTKLRNIH